MPPGGPNPSPALGVNWPLLPRPGPALLLDPALLLLGPELLLLFGLPPKNWTVSATMSVEYLSTPSFSYLVVFRRPST